MQILEREPSRRSKEIKEATKRCASNNPQGFDNTMHGPAFQTGVLILGVLTNNAEVNVLMVGVVTVDASIREIKASIFSLWRRATSKDWQPECSSNPLARNPCYTGLDSSGKEGNGIVC